MKARLLLSAVAIAVAAAASAQTPPPAPQTYTSKDVTMPADRTASDAAPSSQDPRVCLEFEDRMQVIACAEKFRHRRPAAKA